VELTNHTAYPAGIARQLCGEDRIAASVLTRVTYDLRDGRLRPAEQQPWIVSHTPWDGPRGPMESDLVFYKGGVDVFVFGRAAPLGGKPTTEMEVELCIGQDFRRKVRVTGPRVWYRRMGSLAPTAPRPFTSLPLTMRYAFGGADAWDGLQIPYPDNPEGTGFYLSEESAIDKPLPCVEEPDQLITKWDDRPAPAGLVPYPPMSPLRAKHGLLMTQKGEAKLTARFFNTAYPPMIAERVNLGDAVSLDGVSERGPVRFTLPRHAFYTRLRFGAEVHALDLAIDQVGVEVDEQRVFIAYRSPFRYTVRELEARSCELIERSFEA